jgi:HlyD family secretion protein
LSVIDHFFKSEISQVSYYQYFNFGIATLNNCVIHGTIMDAEITQEVTSQRRRKTIVIVLISVTVIIVLIWILRDTLKSSLKKSEITTAVVVTGNIENTLNATGEVLPEFEEILTTPINASIKNVIMDAGNKVKAGQSILTLDKSATQTDFDKLKFQLESKQNEISKLKLDLNKSFYDTQSNNDIKKLRIDNLADEVENAKRLFKEAAVPVKVLNRPS